MKKRMKLQVRIKNQWYYEGDRIKLEDGHKWTITKICTCGDVTVTRTKFFSREVLEQKIRVYVPEGAYDKYLRENPKDSEPTVRFAKANFMFSRPDTREYSPTSTEQVRQSGDDGFSTSMAVGMLTDNALLGMAVGGNPAGAILGDMLSPMNDSPGSIDFESSSPVFDSPSTPDFTMPDTNMGCDTTFSCDPGGSF